MLLIEPPRSQADIHFSVLGIPVRVHPFFWLVTIVLGIHPNMRGRQAVIFLFLWIGVVFVSILIHELGHALMARRFGWQPWITLHSFGGLASYRPTYDDPKKQILISFAGPAAGFVLAAVIVAVLWVSGHPVYFGWGAPTGIRWTIAPEPSNPNLYFLVHQLLFVNILWGLVNLLPVYPLDGGQIAREALTMRSPRKGMIKSLWLSVFTGAAVAIIALLSLPKPFFIVLMFGYFAYINYRILQEYRGRGGYGGYGGYGEGRW